MMIMVIKMIKNWLHFSYSRRDMQEEKYVPPMSFALSTSVDC